MGSLKDRKRKGEGKMAVLTAECGRAFTVCAEKSKKFSEQKTNSKTKIKKDEILSKISVKISHCNQVGSFS